MNRVVLCLTETNLTDWQGRKAYLSAKVEQEDMLTYGLDLLWLLALRYYPDSGLPQPSTANRKQDTRTPEQIRQDVIKKFSR